MPIGKPSEENPVGREIAGWPVALNGDVKAAYGIDLNAVSYTHLTLPTTPYV